MVYKKNMCTPIALKSFVISRLFNGGGLNYKVRLLVYAELWELDLELIKLLLLVTVGTFG